MVKILIVDDDPGLTHQVNTWLTFQKYEVTVASTGQAAWEQLKKNQYEVAVLDWDLPDVDGIDILKRFRAEGGTTPIIMLTGHSSIDDKEVGFDCGANDYITKPFNMKELGMRIKALLRTQVATPAPLAPLGQGNEAVLQRGDLVGTRLAASYEFLEVVGEGAYGIVFKARHPRLDKLVAIKMLLSSVTNETAVARFEREARAMSQINHYNVVIVHDYGLTERNRPYMVMEYIRGEALINKIEREGPLPLALACAIVIQICKGLQEAHSKGIIHRDLKPENIVLQERSDKPDWVKIVDFGTAHLLEGDERRLTAAGAVAGSALFMAPERLQESRADERSDIYSVGAILFETLTSRPIFTDDSVNALLISILARVPDPPSSFRNDIAPGSAFDHVVLKALEKDPEKRYQTATEMRLDLERISNDLYLKRST